jgi:Flp pilus assembly protein TadD
MVGVIGLLAAAIAAWYAKAQASERPVALALGAVILAVLGYSSFRYAHAWIDEESLWPHTIAGHPNPCHQGCGCWQAHNRLGAKKFAKGDLEAAHYHFQNSTRLRPDLGETHNNLGTTHSARSQIAAQQGNQEVAKREMNLAIEQFGEAHRVTPYVPMIQINYANSLAAVGRFGEAADQFKQLLAKMPKEAGLWNNYGVSLFKNGDTEKAIAAFREALAINPNFKDAKESLAVATGEKPAPPPPPPPVPGGQLQLQPPSSPTLGPAPLGPR